MAELWGKNLSATTNYDAISGTNKMMQSREGTRLKYGNQLLQPSQNGIVGINANQIPAMKKAIDDYVVAIKTHLNKINPTADANSAFKGEEVQKAVEEYVTNVKTYCFNLTSQLRAFEKKLDDIKATYDANKQTFAKNIRNDAGTVKNAAGSEFTI